MSLYTLQRGQQIKQKQMVDEESAGSHKTKHEFPTIGVEPVMFLCMGASMATSVVEEQFYIYKVCSVNLGFSKNICHHISEESYHNYSIEVQIEVSKFYQYEGVASHAIPFILAFFLGGWSDRVGRKLPLLLGISGLLIYYVMMTLNAVFESWPIETVLYTVSFPSALTGTYLTIFMSCFAYLSDTTTVDQRTVRTTLLEVAYLLPMPLGTAFGSYLFNGPLNHSFEGIFLFNCIIIIGAIIYTFFMIPWRTSGPLQGDYGSCTLNHVSNTLKTIFKKRNERRRLLFIVCLVAMSLYTLQRDESRMVQLYTQWKFDWDVKQFSLFRTFQSSFFVLGLLVGIPLLQKFLSLRDTCIMMIGALSHITARIIFIFIEKPFWYYVGSVVATFGPVVAPVLRSMISKLVPRSERGKAFALLAVTDTTVPLVSSFIFSQVYINTIKSPFPEAFYLVTVVSQLIVFIIALFINNRLQEKNITEVKEH